MGLVTNTLSATVPSGVQAKRIDGEYLYDLNYFYDDNGKVYEPGGVVSLPSSNENIPVFKRLYAYWV